MRVLLILYLTKSLIKGDIEAFAIYGAYTALVYAAPVLGGKIADKIIGYKNAVILGGILMAIGEFFILGGTETWLYVGMGAIIVGNGYFKANISSIVGKLYTDDEPSKRDAGFTIFYIGINIGALLSTLICAEVGEKFGFQYGFALAGLGMIIGVITFVLGQDKFKEHAAPPDPEKLNSPWIGPLTRFHVTILGSNIAFWACFEQAGSSLTLFADRNVNRMIFGYEMGAGTTQFFNPAYIMIFGALFSIMWIKLSKVGMNPNIPMKFGLGIMQLGLGYLVVLLGSMFATDFLVPLWTVALLYLLHTTGELFLSPIGLSMVTKLAPKHMTGTVMGAWFLSFAASNYVAAILATATGSLGEEGAAVISASESLILYTDVYTSMGLITIGIGLFLVLISKPLNKMMHGVT
jgi:POT family proton-dependent oligopeptide transporter